MDEEVQQETAAALAPAEEPKEEAPKEEAPKAETPQPETHKPETHKPETHKPDTPKPESQKPQHQQRQREERPPKQGGGGERGAERGGDRGGERSGDRGGDRRGRDDRRPQGGGREGGRPGGGRPFEGPADIELEKLIADSLYLDNQAHAVVARMRDMDSGTKSQLRRLYNAVRRAVRAPESERQHQFVMLRARLAYTIARHSLRSLDALERLLLQVTRKNDARGYERFKDLFEAIVAYNE